MKFQIDPTLEETRRACTAIVVASMPPSRRSYIMIGLYVVIVAAAFLLTPATRPMTIIIGVGAVMATEAALRYEGRSRARRLQARDAHATEEHFIELSPESLHAWCAHVDSRYAWSDINKVTEDREFYLFLRGSGSGFAIPKRLLDASRTVELRARIREWATDHGAFLKSNDGEIEPSIG